MKKALQKNNNSKEQGNAERLTQDNNSLRSKMQVWWHKSISLASNQGTVMASFVLEAKKKKLSRPKHAYT